MNPNLLVDISQIPRQLAGLAAVTRGMAAALMAFAIPFTLVEMNVRSLKSKETPSYSALATRVLAVTICLLCYPRVFSFPIQLSQALSFAVLSEQDWGNFLVQTLRGSDASFPTLSMLLHSATSVQEIILFLSSLLALTARDVIVMLQGCFLSILYIFGPIAIVCGINPKSASVTRGWLANTFQVALWSFFLRLVIRVWLALNPLAGALGQGGPSDYLGILAVNVTFCLLVLGTPVVAARLLSDGHLAAFAQTALGTVQTVAVARTLKAGKVINQEIGRYQRSSPAEKTSFFHHPLPATVNAAAETMTSLRQRLQGRWKRPNDTPQGRAPR